MNKTTATAPKKPPKEFASSTKVDVLKTRHEIEVLLAKHGATSFGYIYDENNEQLAFEVEGRRVRLSFPRVRLENAPQSKRINPASTRATTQADKEAWLNQQNMTRWRQLLLLITAKLAAVQAGITTIEEEFLSNIVLPNNQTVHQWASPQLRNAYTGNKMPPLLPGGDQGMSVEKDNYAE